MSNKNQDSILIDKYLAHTMSQEETALFAERLQDPVFAAEVRHMQSVQSVVQDEGQKMLRTLLHESDAKLDAPPTHKPILKYILVVLALIAMVYVAWSVFINNEAKTPDQIYIAHHEKFANMIAPTVRSKIVKDLPLTAIEQAMYAYENDEFATAVAIMDTLTNTPPKMEIYHALANFELHQFTKAENQLKQLSQNSQAQYHEAAQWYLCLLYLRQHEFRKCNQQLETILSNPVHKYRSSAQALKLDLQELE